MAGANLFEFRLASITDVGNDQGRRVRLRWNRHPLDRIGASDPVTGYTVFRRVEQGLKAADLGKAPPGQWDLVTSLTSAGDPAYSLLVETLCDSTGTDVCWSTFFVRATTANPFQFFNSVPDSGYSIDNLPPQAPQMLVVDYGSTSNGLSWTPNEEDDLRGYLVYRGSSPNFDLSEGELLGETPDPTWTDATGEPFGVFYRITALDFAGNESEPADPAEVTAVDGPGRSALRLEAPFPNPFNPSTTLRFTVAETGPVQVDVLDLAGRRIDVLHQGVMDAGTRELKWHGTDVRGAPVASGVYLARLRTRQGELIRPMVLVK